jgi:hypothetical protein
MDCCEVPRLQHDDDNDGIGRTATITLPPRAERRRLRRESFDTRRGGTSPSKSTSNNCEVGGGIRPKMRGSTCHYLCIRAFLFCVCNKNTKEHAPAQKTPSKKKRFPTVRPCICIPVYPLTKSQPKQRA